MTERHDELLDLCAGYVLGSLSDEDRGRLERHLDTGCDKCAQALQELSEGAMLLAGSVAATPDPALKSRVMDAVGASPGPANRLRVVEGRGEAPVPAAPRRSVFPAAALGWAAAAMFAIVSFMQFRTVSQMDGRLDELLASQARLEQQLAEERQWNASMASPTARVAFMAPTPDGAPNLAGWALFDPSSDRAIVVLEQLQREPGRDYELWAIRDGVPKSLGVIDVEESGRALVRLPKVEDTGQLAAFAVSYEPQGGSPNPVPSGPVVMVGGL